MRNNRTGQKIPDPVGGDEDFNRSFFEPSGLVSDPVPHSRRPSQALSETGELRLEELRKEVFAEAANPLDESMIPPISSEPEPDLDPFETREPGTGVIMLDDIEAALAAQSGEDTVSSSDAAAAEAAAPGTDGTSGGASAVSAAADSAIAEATAAALAAATAAADASAARSATRTAGQQSEPVDPWLQDILDEQKGKAGKQDFSKYQGHFALLNEFTVPGSRRANRRVEDERPPKVISEEESRKQAEADLSRFVENEEEAVDVRPRELLSASMYDDLINWSSRLARETPLFNRAFGAGNCASVCDVGCGSGRHCVMFAQWGMKVLGIDSSPSMLKRAQKSVDEVAADIEEANGSVSFKRAHLGGVAEAVGPERTEAIVCVGDVLPHVESLTALKETLNDFADALLPSGILVLEFTNHTHYVQNRIRTTTPVVFDTVEGTRVFLSVLDYPAGSVMVDTEMLSLTHGKEGKWKARSEHVMNFFISPDGIERELLEAGFDIIEMSGDFNGKPLAPLQDESIVIIARRKRHRPAVKRRLG